MSSPANDNQAASSTPSEPANDKSPVVDLPAVTVRHLDVWLSMESPMSRSPPLGPYASFDPQTLSVLREVFEAAWHDICSSNASFAPIRADLLRERLAANIMTLAKD